MAFKHEATLIKDGNEIDRVKICYQNRTWESFEFESVIIKLLEKNKNEVLKYDVERKDFISAIAKGDLEAFNSSMKMIGAIAALGEVFGKDQKESNDWKARMLKAGLENKGLIMPEDWDSLSEDEKERRLDGVIAELNK